jgi:hypothetical protein
LPPSFAPCPSPISLCASPPRARCTMCRPTSFETTVEELRPSW